MLVERILSFRSEHGSEPSKVTLGYKALESLYEDWKPRRRFISGEDAKGYEGSYLRVGPWRLDLSTDTSDPEAFEIS